MSVRREERRNPKTGATRTFWYVDIVYTHPDGRTARIRKVAPGRTKRSAEQYEREVRQALSDGTYGKKKKKEVPLFKTFAAEWLDTYVAANNRKGERDNKHSAMENHLLPLLGQMKLDAIRSTDVERLKVKLLKQKRPKKKKGLKPKTVNNMLGILGTCLRHAVEAGHIDKLPVIRRLKVPPPSFDFLDFDEAPVLIDGARAGWPERAIRFALRTGLRQGEHRGLRWDVVDFRRRRVFVRVSLSQDAKREEPPKNGRTRYVPLSDEALQVLKDQRAESMLKSEWVFCDPEGGAFTRAKFEHQLIVACRRAGMRKVRWHDLRHTFASHLVMKGVSLRAAQELLGHSSITVTQRYAHLAPRVGREAVLLLDAPPPRQHDGNTDEETG